MIYVIGDLHLSFSTNKPMDIFGNNWENHSEKIKEDWNQKVTENDTVILPGDFSWGMDLEEAKSDFDFLNNLPGRKILLKGNHDYWWNTLKSMNRFIAENGFRNIYFLYNNSYLVEDKIIVGTKGWTNISPFAEDNQKILKRELIRLELSIKDGIEKYGNDKEIICFTHYPMIFKENVTDDINYIKLMKKYGIKRCYYGHLHGESHTDAKEGDIEGIEFKLVSSDYLDFKLIRI